MAAAKAAKNNKVSGYGAYKRKAAGGGGRHYYEKYKAAKAAASAANNNGGWLSEGLGSVGNMLMPGLGGMLGRGAGSLIKSITGFGDYEVKENSLMIPEANDPPMVVNSANKSVIIRHREYIDDIVSSPVAGAFSIQNFYINPGDRVSFPWLSQIADSFEHYRIRGLVYEFRTMSADALNSVNTSLGQVIMATSYNSALANFSNKYEMENYEYGCSTKPSASMMHPVECAKNQTVLGDLYVRPSIAVPDGSDRRLYDFGNFQIATNGLQGTSVNCGELWVTYEIELFKPKVITEEGLYIPYVFCEAAAGQTGVVSQANPFGATTNGLSNEAQSSSTVGITNTSSAITLQKLAVADYRLQVSWRGSAAVYAITTVSWTISGGTQTDLTWFPQTYNTQCDSFVSILHFRVDSQNQDVVLTPSFASSPPSGSLIILELVQVPQGGGVA